MMLSRKWNSVPEFDERSLLQFRAYIRSVRVASIGLTVALLDYTASKIAYRNFVNLRQSASKSNKAPFRAERFNDDEVVPTPSKTSNIIQKPHCSGLRHIFVSFQFNRDRAPGDYLYLLSERINRSLEMPLFYHKVRPSWLRSATKSAYRTSAIAAAKLSRSCHIFS